MKNIIPYLASAVIAIGAYFGLDYTFGDAVNVITDQSDAIEACKQLLERNE